MRFLVDMPLSPALARWLIDKGHNAVHASDIGLAKASDAEILGRAKQEVRTVITVDLDYSRLLVLTRVAEPSLILFRGGNWSESDVIARMVFYNHSQLDGNDTAANAGDDGAIATDKTALVDSGTATFANRSITVIPLS